MFAPHMMDSDLNEIVFAYSMKRQKTATNFDIQDVSENNNVFANQELRMDMTLLDPLFDKWLIENEALSGVLNSGLTKKKNQEFRQKLEAWKKRAVERKRIKRRTFE